MVIPDKFNPGRFTGALIYATDGITLINTPTGDSGDTALAVHIEHLHQTPWLHPFTKANGVADTLNGAVAAGAKVIVLNDASTFSVNDEIHLALGSTHTHMYRKITVIATNTVTLDAAIDIALTDGSDVIKVDTNMAVDGSITPVVFTASAAPGEKIDLIRLLFSISSTASPDDSKFGGIAALTNGVHIRRNINDTTYQTIAIWRANKDMKLDMYNVDYAQKAGGGNWGTNGRWSVFDGTGAVINIDNADGETLECIIQDNLTGLLTYRMKGQGHIET
ncbi:hypothetical protein KAR91_81790 [Candidatus Pacearchaeota archaeon]|nr:hypothetical protein [Candidatus Pacearchaeota archaeon]